MTFIGVDYGFSRDSCGFTVVRVDPNTGCTYVLFSHSGPVSSGSDFSEALHAAWRVQKEKDSKVQGRKHR